MKAFWLIIVFGCIFFSSPLATYGENTPDADTVFISGYLDIYRTALPNRLYLDALNDDLRFVCNDEIDAYNQTHDEFSKSLSLYNISEQIRKQPECFKTAFLDSLVLYRGKIKKDLWGTQYGVIAILLSTKEMPILPSLESEIRLKEQSNTVDSLLN